MVKINNIFLIIEGIYFSKGYMYKSIQLKEKVKYIHCKKTEDFAEIVRAIGMLV